MYSFQQIQKRIGFAALLALSACGYHHENLPSPEEQKKAAEAKKKEAQLKSDKDEAEYLKKKDCVDTALDNIIEPIQSMEQKLFAAQEALESAYTACKISEAHKKRYEEYTDVMSGLLPDSVETLHVTEGKQAIEVATKRLGKVLESYVNGFVLVRWNDDGKETEIAADQLSGEVARRAGVYAQVQFIDKKSSRRGQVLAVFANGQAWVRWTDGAESVQEATSLSPKILKPKRPPQKKPAQQDDSKLDDDLLI